MINIRPVTNKDWPAVWLVIEKVFRAGETYPFPPDISELEAQRLWIDFPEATYVALDENDQMLGTYYIKSNQMGLGSHVCNCGYIVAEQASGKGVGSAMCEHSQKIALDRGFMAMQYNLVVSTNKAAVHLWKKQGFDVIGALPKAFNHQRFGYVDAFVMYKLLKEL